MGSHLDYLVRQHSTTPKGRLDLFSRIRLAWQLIVNDQWKPTIRFTNGVELDFSNSTLVLRNPTHIMAKETLRISSGKHLIFDSGKQQVPGKALGYPYGIWHNTDLDGNGDPILDTMEPPLFKLVDINVPLHVDALGNLSKSYN